PWQRNTDSTDETIPWLTLILLQEDEWTDPAKVETQSKDWETFRGELGLTQEITDKPTGNEKPFPPVKVLYIEKNFLASVMPSPDDLKWLSHVRVGHNTDKAPVERGVLVCNRMPRTGARAEVHLVSLEGRLRENGELNTDPWPDGKIPLLSLFSWQFTCPANEEYKISDKALNQLGQSKKELERGLKEKVERHISDGEPRDVLYRGRPAFEAMLDTVLTGDDALTDEEKNALFNTCLIQTETFKGLMDALNTGWLHTNQAALTNNFFKAGAVPVAHGLRSGGKTQSWYHGPLISDQKLSAVFEQKVSKHLPARNADQLLMYNPDTKMLDASYAAAWELGRLIALSEPRVSQQIAYWKTSHAREAALAEQNLFFSHIPFTDSAFAHQSGGMLSKKLETFFRDLSHLKGVPFQYLVPHESLLPDESLRFFYVDPLWVGCLLDGAFSIGRTTKVDQEREAGSAAQPYNPPEEITGVLLRSDLVSGWPSLLVEGYSGNPDLAAPVPSLEILRFERLGPSVLIVLFQGRVQTLTVHLPPESLHFGFSRSIKPDEQYVKELKNLDTGTETGAVIPVSWRAGSDALRILRADKLVEDIKAQGIAVEHGGQLAFELIEGVPKLVVKIQ
ncbi:MAG: hypothetical protein D6722_25180, partial [Bacteroidetes bacterium]